MNLRVRDNLVYGFHRALAGMGKIRATPLDVIKRDGFERVLVVATTAIGDAVLCTPLLDSLRAANPKARIGFWVSAAAAPLFEGRASLDEVISYHGKYERIRETRDTLKRGRWDLALVANANDPDVIPLLWWSGCRRIIRRPQRFTIYSFMIANPEMLSRSHTSGHAIERNLQFCDLIGVRRGEALTRLDIPDDAKITAQGLLEGVPSPRWIVHPGASRSRKQWGAANYAELVRRILASQPGAVILTGSADEKDACDEIEIATEMGHRVRNLAGRLTLPQLAALFKETKLLISGDTGPYHIAMAVGTPTVTLFAPWDIGSSPDINGPSFNLSQHLGVKTSAIGDPISTISVDRVFQVSEPLL